MNAIAQYDILGTTFASIVPNPTAGTGNFELTQTASQTVMRWTRGVNNGDSNDAQITNSATVIIWAIGSSNVFNSAEPKMGATALALLGCTVPLGAGMSFSYTFVTATLVEFTVTLQGTCAWYVCCLCLGLEVMILPICVKVECARAQRTGAAARE